MSPLLERQTAAGHGDAKECAKCGAPTTGDVCAFCRLVEKSSTHEAVPVELVLG
jgi:recombinational DNA repair protein RecR